ncbi:IS66 family transposase [Caballeronia sp. DA-9]
MLNQWQVLNSSCENGVPKIDNNFVENALRAVSWGRKLLVYGRRQRR